MWCVDFQRNGLSVSYIIYFDLRIKFDNMAEYSSDEENDSANVEFIRRTTSKFHNKCCDCDLVVSEKASNTKFRKVTFSEKVHVRPMYAWSFASKKLRLEGKYWIYESLSRRRFNSQIKTYYEPILKHAIMLKRNKFFEN